MYSTRHADKIGFSKGARVLIGPVNAAKGDCTPVGLLGEGFTLNVDTQYRTKMDHFPQVEAARAVQSITVTGNPVVREWTRENLILALGLSNADVTDVLAAPVTETGQEHVLDAAGFARLPHHDVDNLVVEDDSSNTMVLNTDYEVLELDGQTWIRALTGGALSPADTIVVEYDWTPVAHTEMPIGYSGPTRYYTVWIEEELTTGALTEFQIFKAAIGLSGGFQLNSGEQGGDLPLTIQGTLDPSNPTVGRLLSYGA